MNLIAFTEVETTSPAEETVTTTAPAEESATVTLSPEATAAAEETVVKETETVLDSDSAPILTIGAIDGETVVLFADAEAETTAATETAAAIGFEPMNFVTNLQYMGTGMLTIFIVIGAIILATTAINKIFSKKKD